MEKVNGQASIFIESDKMKAYLEVSAPTEGGDPCTYEAVKRALGEVNVVFGVDENAIKEALQEANWGRKFIVATGKPAVDGKDAVIKYNFILPSEKLKPSVDDKGNVDYREMGLIHNVRKGELLAERTPPIPGEKGMDVQGRELLPRAGRDLPLPKGKNTVANQDGTMLYAPLTAM
jgi:uncharacterized protein (DUF342 family)